MGNEVYHFAGKKPKPLTALQSLYIDAFFEQAGNMTAVAKAISRSVEHACSLGKSQRVQLAIAKRSRAMAVEVIERPDFIVTKAERIELLWSIAQKGASLIYDKEGNEVMSAPATSVSAVRTINDMVAGSLAPKEIEVTVKDDTRSEAEIRENIAKLTQEYESLAIIEGVTESDIEATRALPEVIGDGIEFVNEDTEALE